MASTTIVQLIDDLDGSTADETVTFALDSATYEIDLSKANAKKLRAALTDYVGAARRVSARRSSGRSGGTAKRDVEQSKAMREWAKANGYEVSERGRISAEIQAAYNAAE